MKKLSERIVGPGSFLIFALFLGNILNFVYNAFLGRTLSFTDLGSITLINTALYFVNIFFLALGYTVTYQSAIISAKSGIGSSLKFVISVIKRSFISLVILSVIWFLSIPYLANFFHIDESALQFFTPVLFIAPLTAVCGGFLQGNLFFISVGTIIFVEAFSKLIFAVIFVAYGLPELTYLSIPLSIMTAFIVAGSITLFKLKKHVTAETTVSAGFPVTFFFASILSGLATNAFLTFDITLAKHYLEPNIAGHYALLSLIGKMIFFISSLLNVFMITLIGRDLGAKRDPNKTFYTLLGGIILLVSVSTLALGYFGEFIVPVLFGQRAAEILEYLPEYTTAIMFFTFANTFVIYHLARKDYIFSLTSLFFSGFLIVSILLRHSTIEDFIDVMYITSLANFAVTVSIHFLQRNGGFFVRNLVDFIFAFVPLPQKPSTDGKRILVLNWRDTKHAFAGGAEVYTHELAKRWVAAGHQVTLFCGNDGKNPRYEVIEGVEIIRRGGFYFVYVWAFLYYILKFRGSYDVIIDCENGIPFFTPLYAREKVFLLIHHVHQEVFRKSLRPPLSWFATFLEIKLMPFVYRNVKIITVSNSSKKDILDYGISTTEPAVVHNGVDLNSYRPALKNKNPLILYLGRLKFYKSVHIFIRAAKKVLEQFPEAEFIIAGSGEETGKLKQLAKKLNIETKIQFVGKVSETEKINLYQRAWVFVNPSFMEGWGITSIEANACGTPVVASNVPGLRDAVKNPSSGFLVPYGQVEDFADKITELISNNETRETMSLKAREWAQNFDWQVSADKSLKILFS